MQSSKLVLTFICGLISLSAWGAAPDAQEGPAPLPVTTATSPEKGQKVAFLGDSITQFGWQRSGGYVRLVQLAMKDAGRPIEIIPAGVSGNTSKNMLARLESDVLKKKPDWMLLSCGVNDVWHGERGGVLLDEYKKNITAIVDQATAAGIKVVIMTSTMIHEDQAEELNQKLIPYNDFLRSLAAERHLPLADPSADMQAEVAKARAETKLKFNMMTADGVHPNGPGNEMMAASVLKAFEFNDAQLAKARTAWLDLPEGSDLSWKGAVTVRQYLQLRTLAASKGQEPDVMLNEVFNQAVRDLLQKNAK